VQFEDLVRGVDKLPQATGLSVICRRKTLDVRSSGLELRETERGDLTGFSNSKSFSAKKIIGTD
jgi:hypothetical protein